MLIPPRRGADIASVEHRKRLRRGRDLERSLTLLRVFLLASALICAGAGVALGSILSRSLKAEALNAEESGLLRFVDTVERPVLVHGNQVTVPWKQDTQLGLSVVNDRDIVTVKVWRVEGDAGQLAWTNPFSWSSSGRLKANDDRSRIGQRFPLDDELGEAIHENRAVAALVGTGGKGEDAFERNKLGFGQLFEVYAPITGK